MESYQHLDQEVTWYFKIRFYSARYFPNSKEFVPTESLLVGSTEVSEAACWTFALRVISVLKVKEVA